MKSLALLLLVGLASVPLIGDDSERILTIDHFVRVQSTVPAIAGQPAQLYVRERVHAGTLARGSRLADRVVLFVHGAGTPAEVAFDVPYQDYSWMAYLAQAGFDVFSMDMTGYGRSTRPAAMNDPCNLAPDQQAAIRPALIPAPCAATYPPGADDDRVRLGRHRRGRRLHPRAARRGARQPRGVVAGRSALRRLRGAGIRRRFIGSCCSRRPTTARVAARRQPRFRPTAWRSTRSRARSSMRTGTVRSAAPISTRSPASDSVWSAMLASDPVGATWGTGVRRAPQTTTWGWNAAVVGEDADADVDGGGHSRQAGAAGARAASSTTDLGATQKVFIDLGCSSHNAMWEKNHTTAVPRVARVAREGHGERVVDRRAADGLLTLCRFADGTIARPIIRLMVSSSIAGRRAQCRASRSRRTNSMCSSRLPAGRLQPAIRIPGASSTRIATRNSGRSSSACWSSGIRSGAATPRLFCFSSRARPTSRPARPLITHSYDTGAAWENLALQGTLTRPGRPRHGGVRLRTRADDAEHPRRFSGRSDGRGRTTGPHHGAARRLSEARITEHAPTDH